MVIVGAPALRTDSQGTHLAFSITGMSETELVFSFRDIDPSFISVSSDSALIALLIPAMVTDQDIHFQGPVSAELYFRVKHYLIPLLAIAIPRANEITITATEFSAPQKPTKHGVLTGLSNGIDSLHACTRHLDVTEPAGMRLTHLIFHDVGSHGEQDDSRRRKLAANRLKRARLSAQALSLPLIIASSNLERFDEHNFQQTHTLRSAALAFSLSSGISRFLFASTIPYRAVRVHETRDIADLDPILLPLLRSETMECFSVGAANTRVEKTIAIADSDIAHRYLDVCVTSSENCSSCWKCLRTLLTLDLCNALENFESRFDLAKYKRLRSRYVSHVLASAPTNALLEEIRELMDEVGYKPSLKEKVLGVALTPFQRLSYKNGKPFRRIYTKLCGFPADH